MTTTNQSSSGRRGCGPILVLMIAIAFMTLGFVFGAGGLYTFLSSSDDGLDRLGLAPELPEPAAETDEPAEPYALAYPLVETLSVPDSIDEEMIRTHLQQERALLKECYLEELERSPETRGEIDLQFSISGSSGDVTAAVTRNNYTGSEALSDCILSNIRQEWSFDSVDSSGVVTVRFQALFLPLTS